MKPNQQYCSVKEFAEIAGINVRTAYDWIHIKSFPASKIGGRVLINLEKVHEWIKRRTIA